MRTRLKNQLVRGTTVNCPLWNIWLYYNENRVIWCKLMCLVKVFALFLSKAFGNASTAYNNNSSRFGKFTQIKFREDGAVCGYVTVKIIFLQSC